ncbi:ATP-dependent DNA helicase RecG [Furfurilactobacillus siliginis]|uniref:ATP-dependent DNA helicase RecG n=2 Tax=Furfurilactobacillus siliginis TaxID=348151 RepID=A0A0R2LAW4_9LACO|nr:ATP-dependent DNA helicase RecG [Furfurilactobacillus siliginis]KRN96901.1 ATP-dependent DNA helicase RecG [Furfurilactobacillus siliginis]GEK28097.1 ATP-dependent DNA helicase RecG [Furfurilactobacillus siliginis]
MTVPMKSVEDPVTALEGVGPQRADALKSLGIVSISDLLTYFPFRYEDLAERELATVTEGEKVTLKGTVATEPTVVRFGRKKSRLNFRLLIGHDVVGVTFFNQPWLSSQLTSGQDIAVYGKWDAVHKSLSGMKVISSANGAASGAIYTVNKRVRQTAIAQLVHQAYDAYQDVIYTVLPEPLIKKYRLLDRKTMIHDLHFPNDPEAAKLARRTATFEEFFLFELRMQMMKVKDHQAAGIEIDYDNEKIKAFIKSLPFELTHAQKKVVNEICGDLKRPLHMNRLLQGDVGSGKTIVAAIVLYAAITAGYQTALMAPTEILAEQHAKNLATVFADVPVNIVLLTGAMKAKARREALKHIENGDVDLIIGTHALISEDVHYRKLGFAIIDEQHRFGVGQRQALREKGQHPDILAMTATPIPRTLQITAYGEMDVSIIDELPAGRKPITTRWVHSNQTEAAMDFIRQQLSHHQQAYVVTPLIEESEALDVKNAEAIYDHLSENFAPDYKVGLLHGRLKNEEKDAVMTAFKAGDYDVLVSTTVIEVGVDVPNATVMLIFDADRFGLAQLHQLRGRVGRGEVASTCILIADPKTQDGIARMEVMTDTTDGFLLAQKDLELRGSGDLLGTKQSGVPEFKVGDPVAQLNILQVAQQEAIALVDQPSWQTQPANRELAGYEQHLLKQHSTLD